MSAVSQVFDPVREFFVLHGAELAVRAYSPAQHALVRLHFEAAERRHVAGRRLAQGIPAGVLLREAVIHYLIAAAYARDAQADPDALDLVAMLPPVPQDPARPDAEPTDDQRVRAVLLAGDSLYLDRQSPEDLERDRGALDRAAAVLRRRVEARTLTSVQRSRWGRVAAAVLVVAYMLFAVVRFALEPPNIAKGKPVTYTSLGGNLPNGQQLVDGIIGTSFGIHTLTEEQPHVVIDLLDTYRITSVKVHNRADGWFDDCLPLVVELSTDGKTYGELARREDHFDADPPWAIEGHLEPARYVRLRVPRRGYIALSEVEVFGKKKR